jgi:Protein of unknown function (DUF1592)/Protein of unknown function (DUF1588)/Protein of unknown function (DUF1595)/Protein of unknown function (DUF1587)/Protein of unknown function (DUF1585)
MRTFLKRVGQLAPRAVHVGFGVSAVSLGLSVSACTGVLDGAAGNQASGSSANTAGSSANGGGNTASGANGGNPGGNPDRGSPIQAAPTWRLTNAEYASSVKDLFGIAVTTPLDPDGAMAGYRAGLVAGDATVQAYHDAAVEVAAAANLQQLAPCDAAAVTAGGADCAAKFIDAVAAKAFRRPLDTATRAGLVALFGGISKQFGYEAGIRGLVEQLLQSPLFLYHLELEEQAKGPGAVKVSGYSMASRLSFLIWGTMPDDALFAKAAQGQLTTPEQIDVEARRLLASPRAHTGLFNFYEQWLRADRLPPVKGGKYQGAYNDALRASIMASFDAQVDASLWQPQNSISVLLTATQVFANEQTASLFGLNGIKGPALQVASVNPAERIGILTHPAIMGALATEDGTHAIKRGVFVWDQLLCQDLPNPPANVPVFPGVPANASVRQAFETFTADPLCMACHRRINPVGFLFENYDTLGAYTKVDDNGQPVNAAGTLVGAVTSTGDDDAVVNVPTASAVELSKNIAGSASVAQCLVKQLYRYTVKRKETDGDTVSIDALAGAFVGTAQNMPELLVGLTKTSAFTSRWNQQ